MEATVPRATKAFVVAFLLAFVVCGLFAIEAWPLTGWRLFSHVRAQQQTGWLAVGVDSSEHETPVPFERMSIAYRGHVQILEGFPSMTPSERAQTCAVWLREAARAGLIADRLRIYRTTSDVGARIGDRGALPQRTLAYTCGG